MNKLKAILKWMKHTLDMYRLLKVTNSSQKFIDHHLGEAEFRREGRTLKIYQSSAFLKTEMKRRYWWARYSYLQIEDICDDALANKLIENRFVEDRELLPKGKLLSDKPIEQLRITKKGRGLLDRALWIIPIGLYHAWFKEYGRFFAGVGIGSGITLVSKAFIDSVLPFILEHTR